MRSFHRSVPPLSLFSLSFFYKSKCSRHFQAKGILSYDGVAWLLEGRVVVQSVRGCPYMVRHNLKKEEEEQKRNEKNNLQPDFVLGRCWEGNSHQWVDDVSALL